MIQTDHWNRISKKQMHTMSSVFSTGLCSTVGGIVLSTISARSLRVIKKKNLILTSTSQHTLKLIPNGL